MRAFLLGLAATLAGCGVFSQLSQDFNGKNALLDTTLKVVVDSSGDLAASKKISPDDAENVVSQAEDLEKAGDVARDLHKTDPDAGVDRIDAALIAAKALRAYLESRQ